MADALERARSHLGRLGARLIYFPTIGSTNDVAASLADAPDSEGAVVIADEQTSGRGRRGRGRVRHGLLRGRLGLGPPVAVRVAARLGLGEPSQERGRHTQVSASVRQAEPASRERLDRRGRTGADRSLGAARGNGAVVNVSSLAGRSKSANGGPAYTASKAGLLGLTRHLAFDYGPRGVRVNAICPGSVDTPLLRTGAARAASSSAILPEAPARLSTTIRCPICAATLSVTAACAICG